MEQIKQKIVNLNRTKQILLKEIDNSIYSSSKRFHLRELQVIEGQIKVLKQLLRKFIN